MDPYTKKRKSDENGEPVAIAGVDLAGVPLVGASLSREDVVRLLEPFSREQLLSVAASAALRDPVALAEVRAVADRDPALRKLFVRGLGWETNTDSLRRLFASYGDVEEAVVISDKVTGRSKGYGFVTFRHADDALRALKEPSKKIDGRMTVTQLAAAGQNAPSAGVADVSLRKIFVGNVPADMPSERLLSHFASYGEVEEGPLGFDKQTGKFRGFALFVYKTPEAAQASLAEPTKVLDGFQLVCKLASEGKKGKPGVSGPGMGQPLVQQPVDMGMTQQTGLPGQYNNPVSSYGSVMSANNPYALPSSMANSVVPGGAGAGIGGYAGTFTGSYNTSTQFGVPGAGGYGATGISSGSSMYRLPPNSTGPAGGYMEAGGYQLPSAGYRSQDQQQQGFSPGGGVRVPPSFPNLPPYI